MEAPSIRVVTGRPCVASKNSCSILSRQFSADSEHNIQAHYTYSIASLRPYISHEALLLLPPPLYDHPPCLSYLSLMIPPASPLHPPQAPIKPHNTDPPGFVPQQLDLYLSICRWPSTYLFHLFLLREHGLRLLASVSTEGQVEVTLALTS